MFTASGHLIITVGLGQLGYGLGGYGPVPWPSAGEGSTLPLASTWAAEGDARVTPGGGLRASAGCHSDLEDSLAGQGCHCSEDRATPRMKGISSLSLHRLDSTWDVPAILDAFLEGARKKLELAQQTVSQAPIEKWWLLKPPGRRLVPPPLQLIPCPLHRGRLKISM